MSAPRAQTLRALRAARIGLDPESYFALAASVSLAAALGAALVAFVLLAGFSVEWGARVLGTLGAAGLAFTLARLGFLAYPRLRAASRARRIDHEFPPVTILAYALARGGLEPLAVIRILAEERGTFGEVSDELGLVLREVDWMGQDLLGALREVASTTPSAELRSYLKGLATILASGADPRDFLRRQAQMQLEQGESRMQRELDHAGLLAEAYVSALLVLPLLLLVVLSVMAGLQGHDDPLVPLLVFGMIPLGTVAYLLLVEMMLPPDALDEPELRLETVSDFGLETARPHEAYVPHAPDPPASQRSLRRALRLARLRHRLRQGWSRFVEMGLRRPVDALNVSGVGALALFAAGGAAVWLLRLEGNGFLLAGSGLLLACAIFALAPIAFFHERRLHRARQVSASLPEMTGKLAGFNERGIGLLQSFHLVAGSLQGPLRDEIALLDRDLAWGGSLRGALRRLNARVRTRTFARLVTLFERASAATGNLKDVFDIAAKDVERTQTLRTRKSQAMMTYVIVMYVVFGVSLYVLYVVGTLFGANGLLVAASTAAASGAPAASGSGMQTRFFQAALVQGACCGLVAGKLGEGHILSGLKHAAILVLVAWIVFAAGVLA